LDKKNKRNKVLDAVFDTLEFDGVCLKFLYFNDGFLLKKNPLQEPKNIYWWVKLEWEEE